LPAGELAELDSWRGRLWELQLIGQDPARYGGYGYGNVSRRSGRADAPRGERAFIISGTQTGGLQTLDNRHYTRVLRYATASNHIEARGPVRPSSESLTHAMIYDQEARIRAVLHVHSPTIWHAAGWLGIPVTAAEVAYGTPAMAAEVERLFSTTRVRAQRIFAMGGHRDGIVAFGESLAQAGDTLLTALRRAQQPQQ
jgi:ribulose-5-phosphate 4-epimerase/fuculose-1-phosphate aldolase